LQVTLYDPYLSASEVVFHEEALYQVYLPLPLPLPFLWRFLLAIYFCIVHPLGTAKIVWLNEYQK